MCPKKTRSISFSLLAFAVLFFLPAARADVLTPGTTGATPTDFTTLPALSLVASQSLMGSNDGVSVTLEEAVYTTGAGDLVFMFQLDNTSSVETAELAAPAACDLLCITQLRLTDFAGFTTDVGYITDGASLSDSPFVDGTAAPDTVDRSADGSTIAYNFTPTGADLAPGVTTDVLVIATDATQYNNSGGAAVSAVTEDSYEPITTPEPSSLLLLSSGLIGLGFMKRKAFQS